jgi:hypothetical protein
MSAAESLQILYDIQSVRNRPDSATSTGLDSLITAVEVLARAVESLERVIAARTDHLA